MWRSGRALIDVEMLCGCESRLWSASVYSREVGQWREEEGKGARRVVVSTGRVVGVSVEGGAIEK